MALQHSLVHGEPYESLKCSICLEVARGHREIQSLVVRCVERGCVAGRGLCGWEGAVGTLEDHVTKCDFTTTPCPKGCKDANEVIIKYFRKELEEHVSSECPGREYQCQDFDPSEHSELMH